MVKIALVTFPLLFLSCCSLPFVDRTDGHPKLNLVSWKNKNVIIILGMKIEPLGDTFVLHQYAKARVVEGVRLYRDCATAEKHCVILASGGDPAKNGVTEAELIKRELLKNQVPETDILTEEKSTTTFHNAKFSKDILLKESPDLIILVTSDAHLRRALKMFKIFGLFPLPAPSGYGSETMP